MAENKLIKSALLKSSTIFLWTKHCHRKMRFYKLSEQRVRRVLNSPKRIEAGIAPNTIALMQPSGSQRHPYEIWVMIQEKGKEKRGKGEVISDKGKVIKIISAWKYPGRTKPGEPLPEEILKEIKGLV